MRDTTLQTSRPVKKEGEGGVQDAGAETLPLQLMLKTMVRQAVPLQSMEVHGGADISTCSPWKGPHAGAGECLKEAVTSWEHTLG